MAAQNPSPSHNPGNVSLTHWIACDDSPRSQTLLTFLGDPQSSVYEDINRWSDAALKAHIVSVLKKQHPDVAHTITVRVPPPLTLLCVYSPKKRSKIGLHMGLF